MIHPGDERSLSKFHRIESYLLNQRQRLPPRPLLPFSLLQNPHLHPSYDPRGKKKKKKKKREQQTVREIRNPRYPPPNPPKKPTQGNPPAPPPPIYSLAQAPVFEYAGVCVKKKKKKKKKIERCEFELR